MKILTHTKHGLLGLLLDALSLLPLTDSEHRMVVSSFLISFDTHLHAPPRKTGEPYFSHIIRQILRVIQMMVWHEVVSAELICIILLHDTIEDATKGKTTPFMVTSNIQLLVGDFITSCVQILTKNKEIETREMYLLSVIASDVWLVLVAKPYDGEDNTKTLAATDITTQAMKVREVFIHYPKMKARAIELIQRAGESGNLPDWKNWIALVKHIHRDLRRHAWKQRRRLATMNIKVM